MASILVEQSFENGLTDEEMGRMAQQIDPCLEVRGGAWRRTSLSSDRRRMVCEFEAPDAESVREALRNAGIPFDRVWSATVFRAEDYPEQMERLALITGARR